MPSNLTAEILGILANASEIDPWQTIVSDELLPLYQIPWTEAGVIQLEVQAGLVCVLILMAAANLAVRIRKGTCVFMTRQGGFLVPGTASCFAAAFGLFFCLLEVWLWKLVAFIRSWQKYPGYIPLQYSTWPLLGIAAYMQVWGVLAAANFMPNPTRSLLRTHASSNSRSSMVVTPEPGARYIVPPRVFNTIFAALLPISFVAVEVVNGAFNTVRCERAFHDVVGMNDLLLNASANAVAIRQTGQTQQVAQSLLQPLALYENHATVCSSWGLFNYASWGVVALLFLIGEVVGLFVLVRRLRSQIKLLERAKVGWNARTPSDLTSEWLHTAEDEKVRNVGSSGASELGAMSSGSSSSGRSTGSPAFKPTRPHKGSVDARTGAQWAESTLPALPYRTRSRRQPVSPLEKAKAMRKSLRNLCLQTIAFLLGVGNYLIICLIAVFAGSKTAGGAKGHGLEILVLWQDWNLIAVGLPILGCLLWNGIRSSTTQGTFLGANDVTDFQPPIPPPRDDDEEDHIPKPGPAWSSPEPAPPLSLPPPPVWERAPSQPTPLPSGSSSSGTRRAPSAASLRHQGEPFGPGWPSRAWPRPEGPPTQLDWVDDAW